MRINGRLNALLLRAKMRVYIWLWPGKRLVHGDEREMEEAEKITLN